jgi:hypothetical protein
MFLSTNLTPNVDFGDAVAVVFAEVTHRKEVREVQVFSLGVILDKRSEVLWAGDADPRRSADRMQEVFSTVAREFVGLLTEIHVRIVLFEPGETENKIYIL